MTFQIAIDVNQTRRELNALGFNDDAIARALVRGDVDRIGPGLYGPPRGQLPSREEKHRERAVLVARKARLRIDGSRALADVSAAAAFGLPLWGLPIQRVVVHDFTRPPGTRQSGVMRLVTDLRAPDLVSLDDVELPLTTPARTVVDIARRHARIPAIALGDAALHAKLCNVEDLNRELGRARGMTGIRRARVAVTLMDGLAESVLESRSRIEMLDLGLPIPVLQHQVYDAAGEFVARIDFYWPDCRLIGEADGELKYESDPTAVRREKARTDRLHELGFRVVRWGWSTVNRPEELREKIARMMGSGSTSFPRIHLAG
ncbi:hypothetical protein [Gordonia sp. CPCC 205333]|uniref:hypothetical protein n=1 Tax=Gordonia sp. CPCC 205333 TaxID=3140790 RepID=UPI003AF3DAB7